MSTYRKDDKGDELCRNVVRKPSIDCAISTKKAILALARGSELSCHACVLK